MIKDLLLILPVLAQVLRMPLDGDAEGVIFQFDGFYDPVFADGAYRKPFPEHIHSLMVEAVDGNGFRQQGGKVTALADGDIVAASGAGFKVGVTFDMLVQRAA